MLLSAFSFEVFPDLCQQRSDIISGRRVDDRMYRDRK
jgi:hypothetical protein